MTVAILAFAAAAAIALRPPLRPAQARRGRTRRRFQIPPATDLARPAAVVAGIAIAASGPAALGLAIGLALWWFLPAVVVRMQTSEQLRTAEALSYQLPIVTGLLSACLSSGATLGSSLLVVSDAVAQPARSVLGQASRTAELGGGPGELAAVLAQCGDPGWQALGAAVVRSSETGAPLAELLHEQAERALGAWFSEASIRARGVAVRSVLPLAVCFLPAFLLLGVAPMVAGLFAGLQWF